jgi:MFS family permease
VAVDVPQPTRAGAFAALHEPAYRWWFGSQILSASGNMAQAVGLAWLVLQLTGSGFYLGLVSAATFGPVLLAGAWAGAFLDRVDHRRALIGTQLAFIAVSSLLAALTATHAIRIWSIFAFALAGGFVFALDAPARQVYVLELVGPERTASAVGLFEVIVNASRVLGPATSGVLIATVGISSCFAANAASFIPPLLVLLRFRPDHRERVPAETRGWSAIREGLSHVRRQPAIAYTMLMAVASGMLFNLGVALPVLATRSLGLGSIGYGGLMAAFGLGAIPGALAAGRTAGEPDPRLIRVLCIATGAAVVSTALSPVPAVAFALIAVAGFLSIWFIALANTLVQLRAAPRLRGRVMGLWTMALPGMNPLTGLVAGAVTQAAGGRVGFGLAGAALVATGGIGWRALAR